MLPLRIVLFDPCADDVDAWPEGLGTDDARLHVCRFARDALRALMVDDRGTALVARLGLEEWWEAGSEALLLMHVARMREPPAPVVVLTGDPERARALLSAQGVTAEILRTPASIRELRARLGV